MIFAQSLDITKNDIVCIVGAGGKSSLMSCVASELADSGLSVLVTTTTKMGKRQINSYLNVDTEGQFFKNIDIKSGVYACATFSDEKALAPDIKDLKSNMGRFDVVLIEADGSACKPLKGWRADEPVIPDFTTKTVGVVDISVVGKTITGGIVHRPELFTEITGKKFGDIFQIEDCVSLIESENGIFQNSNDQQKYIYCSKAETEETLSNVTSLNQLLDSSIKLTAGSVFNKTIVEYY
ncbi:MAG: putative selenium-dependent hydroxylase accessory protein YqeC [Denitrovibrio sp.]|nr:MAG: putative selenium-dependent hydroxylase accessory protein YqeC [Denitrovibrio sp.]